MFAKPLYAESLYAELKCKSNFSFLRGASDSREYVARARELSIPAIAITDINGVYALPRAYEVLKEIEGPKPKLISGAEVTIADHPPLTLIAETRSAYALLCRILTACHAGKEKGEARITWHELLDHLENYPGRHELTAIPDLTDATNLDVLKDLFPKNLYLPLCRYLDGMDLERTDFVKRMSLRYGLSIVATNDPHYHAPARRKLQDCLACIREGVNLKTAGFHLFGNDERYLKSPLQMRSLFADMPEALTNTLEVAERCTFSLAELKYTYPRELIPPGHNSQSYLEELTFQGAHETYRGLIDVKVDQQIRHELALIKKLGYADYFLTIADIVNFAKSRDIICQGRGSAANSLICYVLGITSVDPVAMNLLFERFISEERAEPPDIDVDFSHERREEVIQYIYERYGRHRAAMVAAIRTYRHKSAFLELSKAIGVDVGTISSDALSDNFAYHAKDLAEKRSVVEELAQELEGFPRHMSIHSGGFVISDTPLVEIVPVEPARMEGRTICQWDKNDLETLGLMKVDVLALGFLTAMHKTSKMIGLNWRDIPNEDRKTYQMIQRAETEGTFQIESRAQRSMLTRTRPETFYDLVVQVAIVRPGPNVGQMVHPYIRRRESTKRGKPYVIPDPEIAEVLGRTYGVPIFQEQLMKLAIVKAGFNPGEADQLRRALAGWRSASGVDQMGRKLYEGLIANGVSKEYADELFTYVKGYAHYGFPESHAASFASISYKSAYLKCYYPAEFLCGLINSQPMGFYSIDTLINEAKRNGVKVLPVHPNESQWDATMAGERTLRMGFRNLQRIREADVAMMIEERTARGPFTSLENFIHRTRFPRETIHNMAMADVFACYNCDQRHSFWKSIEFHALSREEVAGQLSLFDEATQDRSPEELFDRMSLLQEITVDYRNLGYSLRGNFMKGLRLELPDLPAMTSAKIKKLKWGARVCFAGILTVIQRPPTAKGVAFITIEDELGSVDLVLRKETYEKYRGTIRSSRFLITYGTIQRQGLGVSVLVTEIQSFAAHQAKSEANLSEEATERAKATRKPVRPQESPRGLGRLEWI